MSHADVKLDDLAQLGFSSYRDYLISEHWNGIRGNVLNRDDRKCRYCGGKAEHVKLLEFSLGVLRGDELDKLVSICTNCSLGAAF